MAAIFVLTSEYDVIVDFLCRFIFVSNGDVIQKVLRHHYLIKAHAMT